MDSLPELQPEIKEKLIFNNYDILSHFNTSFLKEEKQFNSIQIREFNVKKIMKLTIAQRVIRITSDGVYNCKPNGSVTSSHKFENIKINLLSKDKFQFIDKTSDLINLYETKDALKIIGYIEKLRFFKSIVCFKKELYERAEIDENIVEILKKLKPYIGVSDEITLEHSNAIEKLICGYLFDDNNDKLISELVKIFFNTFESEVDHIDALIQLRCIITFLKERILHLYKNEIVKFVNPKVDINLLVETFLQRSMIMLVYNRLILWLRNICNHDNNLIENRKMKLSELSQYEMGIINEITTDNNWSFSIVNLNKITSSFRPYEVVGCIISSIYSIFNTKRIETLTYSNIKFSLVDLFRILFFVISNSTVEEYQSLYYFTMLLSDPSEINGEIGYFVTIFFSAIEFIKEFEIDSITKNKLEIDLNNNGSFDSILNENIKTKMKRKSMSDIKKGEMEIDLNSPTEIINQENVEKNKYRFDYLSVPLILSSFN